MGEAPRDPVLLPAEVWKTRELANSPPGCRTPTPPAPALRARAAPPPPGGAPHRHRARPAPSPSPPRGLILPVSVRGRAVGRSVGAARLRRGGRPRCAPPAAVRTATATPGPATRLAGLKVRRVLGVAGWAACLACLAEARHSAGLGAAVRPRPTCLAWREHGLSCGAVTVAVPQVAHPTVTHALGA